jgi:hypothetical protein
MTTLRIKDTDGAPLFICADSQELAESYEVKLRALASAHGCHLREMPALGSRDAGPFHRCFKVTRTHGVITGIQRSAGCVVSRAKG